MPRLAIALVFLVAGCASSAPSEPSAPLPEGSWRGTLVGEDGGLPIPAWLSIEGDVVEMVAGSVRVRSDRASFADGRLRFRAPSFSDGDGPLRPIRCDVLASGASLDAVRGFRGACRAGMSRFQLTVSVRGRSI